MAAVMIGERLVGSSFGSLDLRFGLPQRTMRREDVSYILGAATFRCLD